VKNITLSAEEKLTEAARRQELWPTVVFGQVEE